jgi:O-methyltransferase
LPWRASEFTAVYRQVRRYTLCGPVRLRALFDAVRYVDAVGIPGALVECGTARGGSAALMGLAGGPGGIGRPLWAFDTFAGLPPPTRADPDYREAKRYTGRCRGEIAEVAALFAALGLGRRTWLIPGLFADTLQVTPTGPIAVLHVDGDWYASVQVSLEHLYPRVAPGGVIQVDDYGRWQGAQRAVDEFLEVRGLTTHLERVDDIARRWIKPAGDKLTSGANGGACGLAEGTDRTAKEEIRGLAVGR